MTDKPSFHVLCGIPHDQSGDGGQCSLCQRERTQREMDEEVRKALEGRTPRFGYRSGQ